MKDFLERIVSDDYCHGRWLNTLSLMENCGVKKIILSEPGLSVKANVLQHAAEEARHAYFFKRKISLLGLAEEQFEDFSFNRIWGGALSKNYLSLVEGHICRDLLSLGVSRGGLGQLRERAYWATTYVIELRAMRLYPFYEEILRKFNSPISIHGVIEEEKNHLALMKGEMEEKWEGTHLVIEKAVQVEQNLNQKWLEHMRKELNVEVEYRTEVPPLRKVRSGAQF